MDSVEPDLGHIIGVVVDPLPATNNTLFLHVLEAGSLFGGVSADTRVIKSFNSC